MYLFILFFVILLTAFLMFMKGFVCVLEAVVTLHYGGANNLVLIKWMINKWTD